MLAGSSTGGRKAIIAAKDAVSTTTIINQLGLAIVVTSGPSVAAMAHYAQQVLITATDGVTSQTKLGFTGTRHEGVPRRAALNFARGPAHRQIHSFRAETTLDVRRKQIMGAGIHLRLLINMVAVLLER